jgi:hypothetical protein
MIVTIIAERWEWMAIGLTLKNVMLGGAGILFVLVAVAAFANSGGAWPLCIGGIALLVFAHFDQIAEISASATGAKITLKQVEQKVVELRRLVILSAKMSLALGQRMGRWGAPFTYEEQKAIRAEAEQMLRDVGIDDTELAGIIRVEWDRYVHLDYIFWSAKGVKLSGVQQEWNKVHSLATLGTPDEVEALLVKADALTEERKTVLDLYRYYVQHGKHRDEQAWMKRHADE